MHSYIFTVLHFKKFIYLRHEYIILKFDYSIEK